MGWSGQPVLNQSDTLFAEDIYTNTDTIKGENEIKFDGFMKLVHWLPQDNVDCFENSPLENLQKKIINIFFLSF